MQELNGYKYQFYILGNLLGKEFVDDEGRLSLTDPAKAKRFPTYREASDYYNVNMDDYYDKLYPQEIRITVEML